MNTKQNSDQHQIPTQQDNKWDKLLRNWAYTRLGHEGMMLDKIDRQNRIVEVLARNAATGDVGDVRGWPEGDDMGVNIGNEIHYHGGNNTPTPAVNQPPINPLLTTKIWPWALAAAIGLAAAGTMAVLLQLDPPAAIEPSPFPQYDIERWIPE